MRAFFPTDLDDVAARLDAAARLSIVQQRARDDRKVTNDDLRRVAAAASDLDDPEVMAAAWDETEYLLSSPENAHRLMEATEAMGGVKATQPAPSNTNEAPTAHRPERSDEE